EVAVDRDDRDVVAESQLEVGLERDVLRDGVDDDLPADDELVGVGADTHPGPPAGDVGVGDGPEAGDEETGEQGGANRSLHRIPRGELSRRGEAMSRAE